MILYRCDYCYRVMKPDEKFFGKTLYKYTNKGDYISKSVLHICNDCFQNEIINPRTKDKIDIEWAKLRDRVHWYE